MGWLQVIVLMGVFSAPSKPILTKLEATPDSIYIEWLPPAEPNGDVTHYKIEYTGDREGIALKRDYCVNSESPALPEEEV